MTDEEADELHVLKLSNELGKFAIPVHPGEFKGQYQQALERLQLRSWIQLIDVSYVGAYGGICRIFRLTPEAQAYLKAKGTH